MDYLVAPDRCETPELVVRSYLPGDGPALNDAVRSSYEHLRPWMPWATAEVSLEESERLAREFRARYLLATDFVLAIFDPGETTLLGGSGFHLREGPLASRSAEIGMWMRVSHASRGLGTLALRTILRWGFEAWPWERLSWKCDPANRASVRVAEKAGMQLEGTLRAQAAEVGDGRRDTLCYAALRAEWNDPV